MKELNLNQIEKINGGSYSFTPAEQQEIENTCKRYGIYDDLSFNSNGTINCGETLGNSIAHSAGKEISSILRIFC